MYMYIHIRNIIPCASARAKRALNPSIYVYIHLVCKLEHAAGDLWMVAPFLLHVLFPPGMAVFSLCYAKSVVSVMCSFIVCYMQILVSVVCSFSLCYVQCFVCVMCSI